MLGKGETDRNIYSIRKVNECVWMFVNVSEYAWMGLKSRGPSRAIKREHSRTPQVDTNSRFLDPNVIDNLKKYLTGIIIYISIDIK